MPSPGPQATWEVARCSSSWPASAGMRQLPPPRWAELARRPRHGQWRTGRRCAPAGRESRAEFKHLSLLASPGRTMVTVVLAGKGARMETEEPSRAVGLEHARSCLRNADPVLARLVDGRPDFDP